MITRRYIGIVQTLAGREFAASYRGSWLGALSTALVPVLFLLTYTIVFSTLIPVKLRPEATRTDYAFFLFSGLVGWNLFADTVGQAPRLFESRSHLLRRAHVPITTVPLASAVAAYYHALIWTGVFVVALVVTGRPVHATVLFVPVALVLVGAIAAGVSFLIALLGVFSRELARVVGPALVLAMFLSPVLYPAERLYELSPWLVHANVLAPGIVVIRSLLLEGAIPPAREAALAALWASVSLAVGGALVRRARSLVVDLA